MPNARSGLSGQLGHSAETPGSYGVWVTPTHFAEFNKLGGVRKKGTLQGQGLAAGRAMMHAGRRLVSTTEGNIALNLDVTNLGQQLLWRMLFGAGTGPTVTATPAYTTTHTIADQAGLSMSMQGGVPPVDTSTVQSMSFPGSKVTDVEFSNELNGILTAALTIDSQDVWDPGHASAKTLAAASYPTGIRPFSGVDQVITITPSGGSATPLLGARKWSAKISRTLDTGEQYIGNHGLKAEPVANGFTSVTGSINADLYASAAAAGVSLGSLFARDTPFALSIAYTGLLITGSTFDSWVLSLPVCYLDDKTPEVDGPAIVNDDYPFTVLTNDAAAVPTLTCISRDTAL
jgi:hypothetical protein